MRISILSLSRTAFFAALSLTAITAFPQEPAEKKAASERPRPSPPPISPEIEPDRRVTFRLRAPNAKEVTLLGEWSGGPRPLTRDEQGTWSITVGPLDPELYGYSFAVDGLVTLDPGNSAVKPSRSPRTSILEIPGDPPLVHEFQDVPHGTLRIHEYRSRSLGRRRGLHVYTPPRYDKDPPARYPVLYLLHGAGDNDGTWTALGRAHLIADNLLAKGQAQPLIIVMPDGHAAPARVPGSPPEGRSRNLQAFERDLLEDVIPFVEASYRVRPDPASHAIAGLSMGGGQSLVIGLNHTDRFSWVGGFSAAVFEPKTALTAALANPKATDSALRLTWVACGKDDRLAENARQFSTLLKENGIHHEFQISEGNHSWPVWRRYLAEFLPLLFAAKP